MLVKFGFYPMSSLKPKGYCRCLRPSACLSVRVTTLVHAITRDFFQIFLKHGWDILLVNISDKFDDHGDGYRSSLNMPIIDERWFWYCLNPWSHFFKVRALTFDTIGPFTRLLKLRDGFYGIPIFVFFTIFYKFTLMDMQACSDRGLSAH